MARKEEDVEIGDLRLRIKQLSASDAPAALARVGRLVGGALVAQGDEEKMAAALFVGFDDKDFGWLREKFLAHTKKLQVVQLSNGSETESALPLRLEEFDGDLMGQMRWIIASVRVNFADFLGAAKSLSSPAQASEPVRST